MDLSHFQARLLALGPDLSRWPRPEAEAAMDLLTLSDGAVALLAAASAADLPPEPADAQTLADAAKGRSSLQEI